MSVEPGSDELRQENIRLLSEYIDNIEEVKDEMKTLFDIYFCQPDTYNSNIESFGQRMDVLLSEFVDDSEEREELVNAIFSLIMNYGYDNKSLTNEHEQVAKFLREFNMSYGSDINRQMNKLNQGERYWSNIRTESGFRNNNPKFSHQIVIDKSEMVEFDSSVSATTTLVSHFVNQLYSAPSEFSEDVLLEFNVEAMESIRDRIEELIDDIEEHEEEILDERENSEGDGISDEGSQDPPENGNESA
jgi:hypothetical protein